MNSEKIIEMFEQDLQRKRAKRELNIGVVPRDSIEIYTNPAVLLNLPNAGLFDTSLDIQAQAFSKGDDWEDFEDFENGGSKGNTRGN